MKAIALFGFVAALLVSSVSAFAYDRSDSTTSYSDNSAPPAITVGTIQNVQSVQQWVGKPATQVIKSLGDPSYTSKGKHGRWTYNYVREPQHVGPIPTYQFIIGRNGDVAAASLIL